MHVHIIQNLRARGVGKKPNLVADVLGALEARTPSGVSPLTRRQRFMVHSTNALEELDAVAREVQRREASCVVLVGGDGSHMAGVSALARVYGDALPPLALVSAGTVGTVSRNWKGVRFAWRELLALLDGISLGKMKQVLRPTLAVRDDRGGSRVGFIFGTGLVSNFFKVYDAEPNRGELAALKIVARGFAQSFSGGPFAKQLLEPVRAKLEVVTDGPAAPHPEESFSLLVASVVPNLGIGVRLTYRAAERLDRFHLVGSGLGVTQLGPQFPRVLLGKPLVGEGNIDTLASRFHLSYIAEGAYILDGDSFEAGAVTVSAGPLITTVSV